MLLLIAAVMMACFTFMSLGQLQLPEYTCNFTTLGFEIEGITTDGGPSGYTQHTWGFFVVSLMSFLIPLVAIFCYKNMRLQKMLCLIDVLFLFALTGIGCVLGYSNPEQSVSWSSVIIAPLIAFLADIFAYNRICSDQRKLRSADRLR